MKDILPVDGVFTGDCETHLFIHYYINVILYLPVQVAFLFPSLMKNCYIWKRRKLVHKVREDFFPGFRLEDVGLLAALDKF